MDLTKKWVVYEVIRVLVVDHDSTTRKIVSKMLGVCGYEVITANCAIDALKIVRERKIDVHLILTEVHLPDMGTYELIEKIMDQTISKLPIVIMSAFDNEITKLGCLFKGALLYLVKPLTMKSIRNLWQFSLIKGRSKIPNRVRNESNNNENKENQLVRNERKKWQRTKRKEQEEVISRKVEGDGINDSTIILKRPKLIWTQQLHNTFLQAIQVLGVDKAHPKEILQHMNIPGLRKENVSSHLQKFHLSLKRDQAAIQKKVFESSSINHKAESVQFPNQQLTTTSPSLSHFGRQFSDNIGVFMAKKPPFGQETQPKPISNNNLPSTSTNSNLIGSYDVVSFESPNNGKMDDSCFSKTISSRTCSVNSVQQRSSIDQDQECHSWFEFEREEMNMSTMHLPSHVDQDQHCMFMFKIGGGLR